MELRISGGLSRDMCRLDTVILGRDEEDKL